MQELNKGMTILCPQLRKWFCFSTASADSLERPKNQVADRISQLTKPLKGIYNNKVEML